MKRKKSNNVIPFERGSDFFFRAGIRYANKRMFRNSLKFLKKAIEKDPYNAEYLFNLACVLAELNEIKKSNEILMEVIKNVDPTLGECYFGLGCNYFDMGDFAKAREYFEKYLQYDSNGNFVEEANDILYYLQIYDDDYTDAKKNKMVSRLALESKRLIGEGMYQKARLKLEKLLEIDPGIVQPRNNLAMVSFFIGDRDRAISLAKSVLKLEPYNIFALLSLALFYASTGDLKLYAKQLKIISKIKIKHPEEFLIETGQFLKALKNDKSTEDSLKDEIIKLVRQRREKIAKYEGNRTMHQDE